MTVKPVLFVLALVLAVVAGNRSAMADTYKSNETPKYTVVRSEGAIELRDYAPRIMAEVTVSGSQSQAINAGFRVLAGYIFGGNDGGAKVAMTTPVTQAPGSTIAMTTPVTQTGADGTWVVQFMMPSEYTLASLPKARDPNIRFVSLPATRQAVIRFSGLAGGTVMQAKETELRSWAAAQGLRLGAGPYYYFYDAPWTLPWNRRNEVAFTLQ